MMGFKCIGLFYSKSAWAENVSIDRILSYTKIYFTVKVQYTEGSSISPALNL